MGDFALVLLLLLLLLHVHIYARFRDCMQDLIERSYVRRDETDHGLYHYVS